METIFLPRSGQYVRLGKHQNASQPVVGDAQVVFMSDVMKQFSPSTIKLIVAGAAPTIPSVSPSGWGWGGTFGYTNWGMAGNGPADAGSNLPQGSSARDQGAGDCWWAMRVHQLRMWAKLVGRPVPQVSDLTLLKQYSAYVASFNNGKGYNLQTGANDLGTDPLGAYKYLFTNPFYDDAGAKYPLGQIVSLTPGDVQQHLVSTRIFEGTGVGVNLQQAQVDQFDQGLPLAYVKGSEVVGGHELLQVGPNGMVEWGERTAFEPSFIENCNDQSEATFSVEVFNAVTGKNATGSTELDVEEYAAAWTKGLAA